jgi:hypothetical protein
MPPTSKDSIKCYIDNNTNNLQWNICVILVIKVIFSDMSVWYISKLINSIQQSPSGEGDNFSASQDIFSLLWDLIHCCVHESLQLDPVTFKVVSVSVHCYVQGHGGKTVWVSRPQYKAAMSYQSGDLCPEGDWLGTRIISDVVAEIRSKSSFL